MKNASFDTLVVKKRCEDKLNIVFRHNGELNGWFISGRLKVARITIPKGRKPIPPKTYKFMAKQLKLTVEEFDGLLECPIGYNEYIQILIKQKVIPDPGE
jgi:hypothetical protein